jgi:hypothetical protein
MERWAWWNKNKAWASHVRGFLCSADMMFGRPEKGLTVFASQGLFARRDWIHHDSFLEQIWAISEGLA